MTTTDYVNLTDAELAQVARLAGDRARTARTNEEQAQWGAVYDDAVAEQDARRPPRTAPTTLAELPIFGWAWRADGRDLRA